MTVYIHNESFLNKDFVLPKDKNIIFENNFYREDLILKEEDIFISFEYKTALEFRLEFFTIPSKSLVITSSTKNIIEVLEDKDLNYNNDYAIFSGAKIESLNSEVKQKTLETIKFLSDVMYQMLEAGYFINKNFKKVDDWIVSFEHPILKIFKIYHIIETSNPSIDFEEEFLINPQFRQMLVEMIMKIIANFIINNEFTTAESIAKFGNWKDIEMWRKLKKRIDKMEF